MLSVPVGAASVRDGDGDGDAEAAGEVEADAGGLEDPAGVPGGVSAPPEPQPAASARPAMTTTMARMRPMSNLPCRVPNVDRE